ncbi:dihydropteroate synthase [Leadbettera azotonutricia]|nr:dihydropteroate synthase [Leadbettera azotonutricia]
MSLPGGSGLDFSGPCLVMAIINCNDDSFYAPSRAMDERAVENALRAEEAGAAIIDFGGESTRPGSAYIGEEEELRRVIPVVKTFRKQSRLPVSVDTRKAAVARAALDAGADIINDISALEDDPLMLPLCAERGAAVVLMHKKGQPPDMQASPWYVDVVGEVAGYLERAARRALEGGVRGDRIILDPGIGFGKRKDDNLALINRLAEIRVNDYPILMALSRKTFIGEITGKDAEGRLAGTLAANAAAIMRGADIIRVHDAGEHADLVKALYAIGVSL